MSNDTKISRYLETKDLPDFFRELADALENGAEGELDCVQDFSKIKISCKNVFGQISLKAKIKSDRECSDPESSGEGAAEDKPKYKTLKKRMKHSFKMLVKMIHDGQMPPEDAVKSFLEDSDLMVQYPGYGDEYYESYTQACEAFRAAYESGDIARMHETIDVLVHEKSRCHAKYD